MNFGTTSSANAPPGVWLTVQRRRQPGFYGSEMPVEIQSQELGPLTGTATYEFKMVKEPILLDPGRMHKEQAIVPDSFDFGYHVDFPLRAMQWTLAAEKSGEKQVRLFAWS